MPPSDARSFGDTPTVLRIEIVTDGRSIILKLSGRIDEEHLAQLHSEIEKSGAASKLDLRDVNLVDRSSVRFLIRCESQGIELLNCPLYIQEWMSRELRQGPAGFPA
jgi:ABC-type transporter Mla MlaB component